MEERQLIECVDYTIWLKWIQELKKFQLHSRTSGGLWAYIFLFYYLLQIVLAADHIWLVTMASYRQLAGGTINWL